MSKDIANIKLAWRKGAGFPRIIIGIIKRNAFGVSFSYIPEGLEAEGELVDFVKKTCERYIREATDGKDNNFDEYIETALINQYAILMEGHDEDPLTPQEMYELYKQAWCESRGYDPEAMDENVGTNGECYACFDEWYANEYANLMEE